MAFSNRRIAASASEAGTSLRNRTFKVRRTMFGMNSTIASKTKASPSTTWLQVGSSSRRILLAMAS